MATVKLTSMTGQEYVLPLDVAKGSRYIRDIVEDDPSSDDAIPLPSVCDEDLCLVIEYLLKNKEEPLLKIQRPLRSTNLVDSGVPLWAKEFICRLPLKRVLDLVVTATEMRIKMLEYLGCARIAADVKVLGPERVTKLRGSKPPMTPEEEKELKTDNEWAWKYPNKPVVDDDLCGVAP